MESTMNIKMLKAALAGLVLSVSGFANAGLITDNGWNTVDIDSGLVFLDLNQLSSGNYASVNNTFSLNGFEWQLATVEQFSILLESVTGTSIPTWAGSSTNFYDSTADLGNLATLISGSTAWVDFYLDGGQFGPTRGAIHASYPDGHVNVVSGNSAWNGLYVKSSAQIPEPSTLAIFALGVMGLASRRLKKL